MFPALLSHSVRPPSADAEWQNYGHDPGGMRFSPLDQINTSNIQLLQRAWTYVLPPTPNSGIAAFEATPLMVDGVLYFTTSTSQVMAVDAETGKQLWVFDPDPKESGTQAAEPQPRRRLIGRDSRPFPAGRRNPNSISAFSTSPRTRACLLSIPNPAGPARASAMAGSIDLRVGVADKWPASARYNSTSPPTIYKDLVITGSEVQEFPSKGPSGDVRAFDVRTGKLVWTFHTVPRAGEVGHDTWEDDSWQDRSGTNVWSVMSVDAERGMVFLPIGLAVLRFLRRGPQRPGPVRQLTGGA